MGYINKILPKKVKPISRDIGFYFKTLIYKFKCIGKKPYSNPIFVLGNQKSGTTAIAALLGELTGKETAIDLFYSGFKASQFIKWKNKNISTAQFIHNNIIEFSAEIIKEPHLSVFYKELKKEYPSSRFAMVIRNPFDNIRSILDRLNVEGSKIELNKNENKAFFHSWRLLLNNSWIGGNKSKYIEVLAERWNIITNTYFENKEDILLIKYEDFNNKKQSTLQELANQLNLSVENDITHLLDQQYQPKGKKEILI